MNTITMYTLFWILTILAIALDARVIHLLRKGGHRMGAWGYTLFAILTDIAVLIVPMVDQIGKTLPLATILCGYIFFTTLLLKIILAIGRIFRNRTWRLVWAVISAIYIIVIVAGTIYPTLGIRVKHIQLEFENLPDGFDGTRIGLFTDVHLGSLTAADKLLQQMVDSLNAAECLFVVNGGDLINIHNSELTPRRRQQLAKFDMPVYSVVGNHDLGYYRNNQHEYSVSQSTADFKQAIEELGWIGLNNSSQWIHSNGDSIMITGIEFNRAVAHYRHDREIGGVDIDSLVSVVPPETFDIIVSHVPQYWGPIRATHAGDLTLSGHTHAMQFKICNWSPSALLYEWWGGTYIANKKVLYISEGVGFAGFPIRLGTPPQIAIITLRKCR